MNPIVINGTVLCDNITGIPRYVYETVTRLDTLLEGDRPGCAHRLPGRRAVPSTCRN